MAVLLAFFLLALGIVIGFLLAVWGDLPAGHIDAEFEAMRAVDRLFAENERARAAMNRIADRASPQARSWPHDQAP